MKVTVTWLEKKVKEINDTLLSQPKSPLKQQLEYNRNFYVNKLQEMDEYSLSIIEI